MFIIVSRGRSREGERVGFPINTRIPGLEPRHSQNDLMTSQSHNHKFKVFGFSGKEHASGRLPHDSASFIEGAVNVKGMYGLGHPF